ncbi:hypothetical protein GPECTOR_62g913 [Gonium pectorale]|uniref:Uncharacterized protein n=1 Tax=Gonium pectorale TaxID=33097 RepID=A0A150G4Q0_GONPE|nr:hypothetical protein GPECTOR_62g913 [Gonium pectorale]|eukprot:KXZ44798.1 hypothetical protein GPECTOR_62g913 [Gonium pectorale]
MPSKAPRASDSAPVGSIEEALVSLKLSVGAKDPEQGRRLDKVLDVLRDVVSAPNFYVASGDCGEQEALWWEAFAEVYESEVAAQTAASGGTEPSSCCKRQILADILVWAEVTQDHYDAGTQRFVTEPHAGDESFQRIGRAFRAVKERKGLGSGGGSGGHGAANAGARGGSGSGSESSSGSACSSETHT